MKKLTLAFILCLIPTVAMAQTLTVSGKSYSLLFNDVAATTWGQQLSFYLTTYDGDKYSLPYYYDETEGKIYNSREMKKIGSLYYTDYFILRNGSLYDWGEMTFNLGSIDSDDNGIDDICEVDKSVNAYVTGIRYSHTDKSFSINGTMVKSQNSQEGSFDLQVSYILGTIEVTGHFYAGVLSGDANYSKADNSITFAYTSTFNTQWSFSPLSTSFEVIDDDTVRIIGKDFFPTTDFVRSGNKYYATAELLDGHSDTFWPDYQKWYIEIEDANDADKDGIPDLSDTEYSSHPPVAHAGSDTAVGKGVTVTLDGSGSSDSGGDIVSYQWSQLSGLEVTLINPSSVKTSFVAPDLGDTDETLTFQLTVKDSLDSESSDTVTVTVTHSHPPVAHAGSDMAVGEGVTVTLDGSGSSDIGGDIVSYQWSQLSGLEVTLINPSSVKTSFVAPDLGDTDETLTFRLTVKDSLGLESSDTITIRVRKRIPLPFLMLLLGD